MKASSDLAMLRVAPRAGIWAYLARRPGLLRVGVILAMVLAWEVLARTVLDPEFISPPSAVIGALPQIIGNGRIDLALITSFYELVVAFGISLVAGIVIGVPIGLHRFSLRAALPIILLAYSIPQVTILPLFVIIFGIGSASKIAFGISHGVFPILLNVIAGVQSVEADHIKAARSMGASNMQIFRRVILPHMIPSLFTGLRLGVSATLLGVILAELYVSAGGIGYYTQLFTQSFNPAAMFALVSVLALMAVLLNETVRRAERRASFWRNQRT